MISRSKESDDRELNKLLVKLCSPVRGSWEGSEKNIVDSVSIYRDSEKSKSIFKVEKLVSENDPVKGE